MKRDCFHCLLLAGSALAVTAASPASAQETPPKTDGDEIVVTAEKRSESLFKVPSSLSVIDDKTLAERNLSTMTDWASTITGLSFSSRGAPGFTQVILRGVTSGGNQTSPTVAIYVDDVQFGTSSPAGLSTLQPDIDPSDVERIEVLRGPQGTLYGASTLGGLIKYVTRKPDTEKFGGSIDLGVSSISHGETGWNARGSINVPIVKDVLALRVSGFNRDAPGFIDNLQSGERDANGARVWGGRASLGIYPTDSIDIRLNAVLQKTRADATGSVDLDANTLKPIGGDLTNRRYKDDFFNADYHLYSATVNIDMGPVAFTSATSFSQIRSATRFDFSPAYGFITQAYSGGLLPAGAILGPQEFSSDKWTQEARLASQYESPFQWRVGFYYTSEDLSSHTQVLALFPTTLAAMPAPFGTLSNANSHAEFDETSLFGDVRYALTGTLEVAGGLRYSKNDQQSRTLSSGLLTNPAAPTAIATQSGNSEEDVVIYQASLKWNFAPRGTVYARVAKGYRPGGPIELGPTVIAPIVPRSYDSDTVINYELGAKGSVFGGKLDFDASLFYIDWTRIQLPTLIGGFNVLSNGGGAVSKGGEFSVTVRPVQSLTLGLRTSYTDAHLTEPAPVAGYADGERLPAVPKWDVSANIDYRHPFDDELTGVLGADFKYQSDRTTGQSLSALNPTRVLPSYAMFDLRAGLEWRNYRLSLFVRNVGDERAYYNGGTLRAAAGQVVPYSAIVVQPRTFGASIGAKF